MYVWFVLFYMNGCVGNPKPNNIQILNILGLLHMTRPNWVLLPHAAFTTKVLKSSVLWTNPSNEFLTQKVVSCIFRICGMHGSSLSSCPMFTRFVSGNVQEQLGFFYGECSIKTVMSQARATLLQSRRQSLCGRPSCDMSDLDVDFHHGR